MRRRIRLSLGRSALVSAGVIICLAATFPLRFAIDWLGLDARGVSARAAEGSIWFGRLEDARLGPVPLGTVATELSAWRLLLGQMRLSFAEERDVPMPVRGEVEVSRGRFAVHDATVGIEFADVGSGFPFGGGIDFREMTAVFEDGECERAEGLVTSDLLMMSQDWLRWRGPEMSGEAVCEEGDLLLPLEGRSGATQARLELRFAGDGTMRLDLIMSGADSALASNLTRSGFVPSGTDYRLALEGSL